MNPILNIKRKLMAKCDLILAHFEKDEKMKSFNSIQQAHFQARMSTGYCTE